LSMPDKRDTSMERRSFLRLPLTVAGMSFLGAVSTGMGAVNTNNSGNRVVVEDFEDGSLDEYVEANQSAWNAYSGNFEVVQGSLSGSGGKYLKEPHPTVTERIPHTLRKKAQV